MLVNKIQHQPVEFIRRLFKGQMPCAFNECELAVRQSLLQVSAERTSTAPSRVPQINRDRALMRGISACKAFTSFSQLLKVFRMLFTLPGRMTIEAYPSTVPEGSRRGSPYIRARAMR